MNARKASVIEAEISIAKESTEHENDMIKNLGWSWLMKLMAERAEYIGKKK